MGNTWKNMSLLEVCVTLEKRLTLGKIWSGVEKWVTIGKMDHNWTNVLPWINMGRTLKNRLHLENGPHLETWVTFGNMGHIWKSGSHLKKRVTLGKWVTLGNMGHTWKNGSHLEKWVTLGKWVTINHLNLSKLRIWGIHAFHIPLRVQMNVLRWTNNISDHQTGHLQVYMLLN